MKKNFLIEKITLRKKQRISFYHVDLNYENGVITEDSFDQFIDAESDDSNLAFFITDEIKFLSFSDPERFLKEYFKDCKEFIFGRLNPSVYLRVNEEIKKQIEDSGIDMNVNYLNSEKAKIK